MNKHQNPLEVNLDDVPGMLTALPQLIIMGGEMAIRSGDHLIFNPFGLTVAHYSLLATLNHCAQCSMTELKKMMFMLRSASSLTQFVDDLEKRNLVRRVPSPQDRRVTLVEISDAGRELLVRVDARYMTVMREAAAQIPLNELRAAITVLRGFILEAARELGMDFNAPIPISP
jgi:DNA-binding MarR family transcriptional regulator